jgi:ApaG protein
MEILVTNGIRISVEAMFVPEQSSVINHNLVFAYRITITNETGDTVQLMRRHWDIIDTSMDRRLVEGEGVIGKQPILAPGEAHTYVSGCVIKTPVGKMGGYYTFSNLTDSTEFRVQIPSFLLEAPFMRN